MLTVFAGINLSHWGICLGIAALCALLLTLLKGRKELPFALGVWGAGTLGALLGGHAVWCLCKWSSLPSYEGGYALLWQPWLGGYCMIGAVAGGLLLIALRSLLSRKNPMRAADLAVPGALLALCLARVAEFYSGQGLSSAKFDSFAGDELTSFLMGFPFTIPIADPAYEEFITWHIPVFFYEALAALVLLVCSLLPRKKTRPGTLTGFTLVCLSASQIFFEQLRNDDCLRFGFVRVTQIAAILTMLTVLLVRLILHMRARTFRAGHLLHLGVLVLCALVIGLVEFAFEKPLMLPWLRISILACACVSASLILDCSRRKREKPLPGIMGAMLVALLALAAVCLLAVDTDHTLLLYSIMALCCIDAAIASLPSLPDKD